MKARFTLVIYLVFGLLLTYWAWNASYVFNENGRQASGLLYLTTGDYSSFHVNPPLVSLIGALPAAVCGAERPTRAELGIATFSRDEYRAGRLFIEKNAKRARIYLFAGRLCCIALVLFGLCFSARYADAAFGASARVVFLLLAAFYPQFLGMGALIVPDVASAFLGAACVFFFWRHLRSPNVETAFLAGCALGLAELSKFTLLIFYPLFVVLTPIYHTRGSVPASSLRRRFALLALIFAVSLFVINLGYAFEDSGKQLRSFKFQTALFTGYKTIQDVPLSGANRFAESGNFLEKALGYLPAPTPKNFIQGIDTQRVDFERGMESYLRGEWSDRGWACYYLYALLLKTPLGTLLLFLLAVYCTFFLRGYNASWRDEAVVLLPGVVILAFVSSQTGISIHSRYVLPALPFFFIWTSKVGRAFTGVRQNTQNESEHDIKYPQCYKTVRVLTIVFAGWSVLSSLAVYPSSIAYFNELAAIVPTPKFDAQIRLPQESKSNGVYARSQAFVSAGPRNGPRHLLGSNVDWGQDLFQLEKYCKARPEIEKINVAYWGAYPLEQTSIPAERFSRKDLKPGWYAVSAYYHYSRQEEFRYFLDFEPVDTVGYSIYIYRLTQEDVDKIDAKTIEKNRLLIHREAVVSRSLIGVGSLVSDVRTDVERWACG